MNKSDIFPSIATGGALGVVDTGLSMLTGRSNMQYQSDLAFENWKKQFNMINEYNKPINQLKRYAAAGVNPFVNPSGSQMVGMSSSAAVPQSAMPSFSPVNGFGNSFSQIMSGLLSAAQAKGKSIENSKLGEFLDAQIREKLSQAGHQEVLAELDGVKLSLEKEFGKSKYRSEIYKSFSAAAQSFTQALLNRDFEPALKASETWKNNMEGLLSKAKKDLTDLEYSELETRLYYLDDMLLGDIEVKRSERSKNLADAYKAREEGRTQESVRRLNSANAFRSEAEGNKFYEEYQRLSHTEKAFVDKLTAEAEIERKKNAVFSWKFGAELAKAVGMGVIGLTGAGKLWKFFRGVRSVEAARNIANQNKKSVGDITEHLAKPKEKGTAPDWNDPKVQEQYPTLSSIFRHGGVR